MKNKRQFEADLMLVGVTLCWGLSYVFMNMCLEHMMPFMLNTYRFVGAFLLICIFMFKKIRTVNKETMKHSLLCALSLVFTYICATYGVMYTSISNSGFLCSLTSIFTPIIGFLFLKQKQEKKAVIAVIVCLVGTAFLTLNEDFGINIEHLKGDLLCIGCGVFYAVNLLTVEKGVKNPKVDAFNMGVFQMGFVGVFNALMVIVLGQAAIPPTPKIWGATIFLAVFSTGCAFILQPMAQKNTSATHAGIIFSLEPVFSAIAAGFIAHEILSMRNYFGALLMLSSIMIIELDWKSIFKKNTDI